MKIENSLNRWLIIIAAFVTTAYLLMLGCFNTLSLDDYGFVVDLSHYTPWEWTKFMYMTWQGRFSGFFVSGITFQLWGRASSLLSWTVIHLLLGYWVVGLIIRDVVKIKDVGLWLPLAVLIENITIMSVLEFSTFYWLCCAGYFLVVYATILLAYVLFFSHWRNWINWAIAILCALYVSGSAENYTPLVLMVLGIVWLIRIIDGSKADSFATAFRANSMLFVVCAILAIGFLAVLLAPGNKVRMQNGNELVGFMYNFRPVLFLKKTIIANSIFFLRLLSRSLYYLFALPLFMYMGSLCKANGIYINVENMGKKILIATILLLLFVFIAVTACVYGIGYYPPVRSMSYMAYVLMAYTGYVGVLLGASLAEKKQLINTLVICSALVWITYGCFYFVREYPVAKEYHACISQRDKDIQSLAEQGNTETYYAERYRAPKWRNTYSYLRTAINKCLGSKKVVNEPYFPYMVSALDATNPADFKNSGLQYYYNAHFDILTK